MEKRDLYQELTDKVVAAIEQGVSPWNKGWQSTNGSVSYPTNYISKRRYNGINVVLLMMQQQICGYEHPYWLTYKQALEKGGNVRKGEKGTTVVFYKTLLKEDKEKESIEKIPMLRAYTVFNVGQCDNVPLPAIDAPAIIDNKTRLEHAEQVFRALEMELRIGGNQPYWHSLQDYIQMPEYKLFKSNEDYYATLYHEAAHATGYKTRLDRKPYKADHYKAAYAFEEAIAELSALFTCGVLGIQGNLANHASYIDGWLSVIRQDKKAIFKAAAAAQKATDWILNKAGLLEQEQELEEAA